MAAIDRAASEPLRSGSLGFPYYSPSRRPPEITVTLFLSRYDVPLGCAGSRRQVRSVLFLCVMGEGSTFSRAIITDATLAISNAAKWSVSQVEPERDAFQRRTRGGWGLSEMRRLFSGQ